MTAAHDGSTRLHCNRHQPRVRGDNKHPSSVASAAPVNLSSAPECRRQAEGARGISVPVTLAIRFSTPCCSAKARASQTISVRPGLVRNAAWLDLGFLVQDFRLEILALGHHDLGTDDIVSPHYGGPHR